jgi:hypothetical protein
VKIKQVLNSVNTKHIRSQLRDLYHRKGPGRKPINPMARARYLTPKGQSLSGDAPHGKLNLLIPFSPNPRYRVI